MAVVLDVRMCAVIELSERAGTCFASLGDLRVLVEAVVVEAPSETTENLNFVAFQRLQKIADHLLICRSVICHRTLEYI